MMSDEDIDKIAKKVVEIQEKEKLLNMVCNFVKSRKQNTPMEF